MKQHDLSYWEDMAERYFQAETSEQEEAQLRRFLCTDAALDPRFDEIRATMSFLTVCRDAKCIRVLRPDGRATTRSYNAWSGFRLRLVAIAACLCIAMFLGWHQYRQYNISSVRMAGEAVEADASLLMQRQMMEVFNPIDQSDR